MLHYLFTQLVPDLPLANLFRYITFRTGGAIMTALVICFVFGPWIIAWLKSKQAEGQPIRSDGPETHFVKKGTPTMGGVMILLAVTASTLLWSDLRNAYVWIVLGVTIGYGLIGFGDDYLKLTKRNTKGLPGKLKLACQFSIAFLAALAFTFVTPEGLNSNVAVPFFKDFLIDLGILFVPFAMFVIVGASNAVNLTDGLDGLAIVPVMIAASCYGLIAYLTGNAIFANYLQIHHVPGTGELAILCGGMVGAALGFLWFNAPPAMVFMGDTGSLSLGGALGALAVTTKHELVLAIIGGLFVLETISVILQVASFKLTGKRIFRMAPLHHHFEKKGWSEPTVVVRFWIVAAIFALLGLATLKLR